MSNHIICDPQDRDNPLLIGEVVTTKPKLDAELIEAVDILLSWVIEHSETI